MGFHSVTFGIKITKHSTNPVAILELVAKEWKVVGLRYQFILHDDIIFKSNWMDKDATSSDGEVVVNIKDISYSSFYHKDCPNIKIGSYDGCSFMIYLGLVNDYDRENRKCTICEYDLSFLMKWKQELIDADRIGDASEFQMISNYCS